MDSSHVVVWGWDSGNNAYVRALVDAAGHLQVDVLSNVFPATYPLPAAQVATLQQVTEQGTPGVHLYGFDTVNWQYLQVEAAALHNLRVKLYDGANAIASSIAYPSLFLYADYRGLFTYSHMLIAVSASRFYPAWSAWYAGDADAGYGLQATALYGFNGTNWDRLRVDAAKNLKVNVDEVRKTNTSTITSISVGVASTNVLAANAARIFAEFVNDSDNVIYLALGTPAVMNRGIRLNANGGSFEIGLTNLYTGAVTAISSVAARNLTVSEG